MLLRGRAGRLRVAGVEAIDRDYARHARAARALAEAAFDSDKVLRDLLAQLGVA